MSFATNMALAASTAAWFLRLDDVANRDATTLATLEAAVWADYSAAGTTRREAHVRARKAAADKLAGILSPAAIRAALMPPLRMAAADVGLAVTSPAEVMAGLRKHMAENAQTLKRRAITYGTPAANTQAGAAGKGAVYRLTVDKYGHPLEALWLEAKTLECIQDEGQATVGQETWQLRGVGSSPDYVYLTGSGARINTGSVAATGAAGKRTNHVANPAFEQATGIGTYVSDLATITGLTGWTLPAGVVASLRLDRSRYYRGTPGRTAPTSLRVSDDITLAQVMRSTKASPFLVGTPYRRQLAVYVESAVSAGTINLAVGTQAVGATALTGLTADAWNLIALPDDANAYYDNFRERDAAVTITVDSLAGGNIWLGEVLVVPFSPLGGTWLAIVGGATPWERQDAYTWTDELAGASKVIGGANDGLFQYALWRADLGSLPSAASGFTVPEPSV